MNEQFTQNYQAPYAQMAYLNANRSLLKYILLNIVTLGIYSIVYYSVISSDINQIARYDGKKQCIFAFWLLSFLPLH